MAMPWKIDSTFPPIGYSLIRSGTKSEQQPISKWLIYSA